MELTQRNSLQQSYWLAIIKSFLIWSFTLTVCLLVVGFPLVVLMATVGALSAVILQSVLPISSVLLVAGSIIGANILFVIVGAALLTTKGIHPQEVSWLRWLHGEEAPSHSAIYASCPLTCSLTQ
ncbi:conserved hypothetical protein [Gloeothece citriformis PCC 7424]|uniref:Uncharacterized protein n=1 Tax=Gloeothece citriformis (strain PCC 7424) TaxID=65393 RepID=B7KFQ8_GLOC7|nr:hypothetical protein [Gloeothece citriformis]ACK73383.1 conserved hypothetical protein [Gloeothece citriformis PCC 7424]